MLILPHHSTEKFYFPLTLTASDDTRPPAGLGPVTASHSAPEAPSLAHCPHLSKQQPSWNPLLVKPFEWVVSFLPRSWEVGQLLTLSERWLLCLQNKDADTKRESLFLGNSRIWCLWGTRYAPGVRLQILQAGIPFLWLLQQAPCCHAFWEGWGQWWTCPLWPGSSSPELPNLASWLACVDMSLSAHSWGRSMGMIKAWAAISSQR